MGEISHLDIVSRRAKRSGKDRMNSLELMSKVLRSRGGAGGVPGVVGRLISSSVSSWEKDIIGMFF